MQTCNTQLTHFPFAPLHKCQSPLQIAVALELLAKELQIGTLVDVVWDMRCRLLCNATNYFEDRCDYYQPYMHSDYWDWNGVLRRHAKARLADLEIMVAAANAGIEDAQGFATGIGVRLLYDDDVIPVLITCLNDTPNLLNSTQWQAVFNAMESTHRQFNSRCATVAHPAYKVFAEHAGRAAAHMHERAAYADVYFTWLKQCFGLAFMEANAAMLIAIDSHLARQLFLARSRRPLLSEEFDYGLQGSTARYLKLCLAK